MTRITTTHGDMDDADLVKTEGSFENDNERTSWVEYRLPGSDEIVHRSAHVFLKQAVFGVAVAAEIG